MTRTLILLVAAIALTLSAAACSSDPLPGEPGGPCLARQGETTPLYCVCGYPCVDGVCQQDPDISCRFAP